jgi:serine/threonine protein phosphatase PrpC
MSIVALFDGHGDGGAAVAQHCADRLAPNLKAALIEFCGESGGVTYGRLLSALTRAFVQLDDSVPVEKGGATVTMALL